ncbi:hypothetical protein NW064_06240 [Mycoplasmopsis felis]|uniref:hypothetical protein n=1 Tax=Mycoplasmopsis felis TaxID=33923 RepID=UPI0021AFD440|nr:hypothetical protein [Mycoplasmopsis felis]UWW00760.1 hypothetical protein NW064_06240 [Mycoplasmopsis felis]
MSFIKLSINPLTLFKTSCFLFSIVSLCVKELESVSMKELTKFMSSPLLVNWFSGKPKTK